MSILQFSKRQSNRAELWETTKRFWGKRRTSTERVEPVYVIFFRNLDDTVARSLGQRPTLNWQPKLVTYQLCKKVSNHGRIVILEPVHAVHKIIYIQILQARSIPEQRKLELMTQAMSAVVAEWFSFLQLFSKGPQIARVSFFNIIRIWR